jgi:hypothetical protein
MLSPISTSLLTRTGRANGSEASPRGAIETEGAVSRRAQGRAEAVSRFHEVLRSQRADGAPDGSRRSPSATSASATSRSQHSSFMQATSRTRQTESSLPEGFSTTYSRGTSSQAPTLLPELNAGALPPMGLPMQYTYQGPPIDESSLPPMHPVYNVPMVHPESLNAYIHPLQRVGAATVGDLSAGEISASNVYRVPAWGMQDFVTSDGFRHRFDMEVVFGPGSVAMTDGQSRPGIHPEVADFVLDNLRQQMEKAGIPQNAIASMNAMRMHGGTTNRTWHLDQIEIVSADGRSLYPSMNAAMRDPRHTIEQIQEFLGVGIPT